VSLIGRRVVLKSPSGEIRKIAKAKFSEADLEYVQLANPPALDISFSKQSSQRSYLPDLGNKPPPTTLIYNFSAKIKQSSPGDYDHSLHAELFVIGAEVGGNKYLLLD